MSASLGDLINKCIDKKEGYDMYSDSIASYVGDVTKNM